VSNLLSILSACTDRDPDALAGDYSQYGPHKKDTAEAVVALLEPIQVRFAELSADPAATGDLIAKGADKANTIAVDVLDRARDAVGLLPRRP
jgi:tryptophanyl-tRNA synthetase